MPPSPSGNCCDTQTPRPRSTHLPQRPRHQFQKNPLHSKQAHRRTHQSRTIRLCSAWPQTATTSAISEMHRAAPPPQTDAEATTSAPDVETSVGATMGETTSSSTTDIAAPKREATSERNAKVAAYGPTAAPEVIAPIDDAASSSIPKDVASQPSTSSDLRSDVAGPASDVSVAKSHAPMPHPIPSNAPADLMSDDWQQTSPSYEIIGNAGAHARTLRSWWS